MLVSLLGGMLLETTCPAQDAVLLEAAAAIESRYVVEAQAHAIGRHLRDAVASGRYASACADTVAFLEQVNRDLDVFDGHFLVEHASARDAGGADWLSVWRAGAREVNAGIREVRVFEGNIGLPEDRQLVSDGHGRAQAEGCIGTAGRCRRPDHRCQGERRR